MNQEVPKFKNSQLEICVYFSNDCWGCNIHNGDISTAGGPHITVSVLDSLPLTNLLPLMTHTILR